MSSTPLTGRDAPLIALRVIERIEALARARASATSADLDAHDRTRPSLSSAELEAGQARLGVVLPGTVRMLYEHVANGGFGPAYGLLALVGGPGQEDVVDVYDGFRTPDPDDAHWQWPAGLLPIVSLGCGMYFCVDCADDEERVIWFEPNPHCEGEAWTESFIPMHRSFGDLMLGWAAGEDSVSMLERAWNAQPPLE